MNRMGQYIMYKIITVLTFACLKHCNPPVPNSSFNFNSSTVSPDPSYLSVFDSAATFNKALTQHSRFSPKQVLPSYRPTIIIVSWPMHIAKSGNRDKIVMKIP